MGGYGSGSHHYYTPRSTVEGRLRLDVRRLHRAGLLAPNTPGTSTWTRNGRETGSIGHAARGEDDEGRATALELRYSSSGQPTRQSVPLEWTPCHYGGARPWFNCPLCDRRVALLYAGARFACRHCHDLAYESTRQSAPDRGIRKAQNIRERLGGSANLSLPFPPKPKGMHWRTYYRLEEEAQEAYLGGMLGLMAQLDKALGGRLGTGK